MHEKNRMEKFSKNYKTSLMKNNGVIRIYKLPQRQNMIRYISFKFDFHLTY